MQSKCIVQMDYQLNRFARLKVLNLSFNGISRIENLPGELEELYLNGNCVDMVAVSKPVRSLLHLGLSMNKIR